MIRPAAVGLFALACTCGAPALSIAQDLEQGRGDPLVLTVADPLLLAAADPLPLAVRMTAPAGGLWQTPVYWEPPTRGGLLPSLYVGLIALQAYDGYSTSRGLKHGAIESNTFLRRMAANPTALWAVKGGATFVSIYMAERLWRQNHRGRAVALMVITNGLMAAVALNNASVLRSQN
jgi:hypothetical protein